MADESWTDWFTARTISFPSHARDVPEHCVYRSNASGSTQLYAWDRDSGRARRLTDRADGTLLGSISPDGRWIWWFDDEGGNEQGRWVRQPFDVERDHPGQVITPELAPGASLGLALGCGIAVFALSRNDGTMIYRWSEGAAPTILFESRNVAWVSALSYDETLLAITHTEHAAGDTFDTGVRLLDTNTGAMVAEVWDGQDRPLVASAFAPRDGDRRLIVHHERRGAPEPMVWDPSDGTELHPSDTEPDGESASEIGTGSGVATRAETRARWYPDASALLLRTHRHGRDRLFCYDLAAASSSELPIPPGTLSGYAVRPGSRSGSQAGASAEQRLEFELSSGGVPPSLRDQSGSLFLQQPDRQPESVPLADVWVPGPGGPIHALLARVGPFTRDGTAPAPTIVVLHGGPGDRVSHSFWPLRAAFVQQGFNVVHVNYRGSSGYGSDWEHANRTRPGLVELEDVAATRDWLVRQGIADPERCVLSGISWGGYLTLLGLGTQPDLWAAGIADVPIGDLVALYEDEMEPVREADRSLFGGTPDQLPQKWARSSPLSYVEQVRVPLLVIAGRNDVRCPYRQVRNYLDRLDELGTPYEFYEFGAGHTRLVVDEQVRQVRGQLDFLRRHLPPDPARSGAATTDGDQ